VAALPHDRKKEIFAVLNKEFYPGEPLYNGKTSRQIISSWTLESVRNTRNGARSVRELHLHDYIKYGHFVVANMIEDPDENLYYIREVMCKVLFWEHTDKCVETVIKMVLNTPATKKYHEQLQAMIKRYRVLLDAKTFGQPLRWDNIPKDLVDEISALRNLGQDIQQLVERWLWLVS
jgi:hypothetical protein